jgi:signal transduction histidine kinase
MQGPTSDPVSPVSNKRFRTVVLVTAVSGASFGVVAELIAWDSGSQIAATRAAAFGVLGLLAAYKLATDRRTEGLTFITAVAFATLSLVEATNTSGFDTGSTLALLILSLVVYVTTRLEQRVGPLILASSLIALYTVITVIVESQEVNQAAGKLLIGIPGQMLVAWITWRLIQNLGEASRVEANRARIQEALSTCSQALLIGRDEAPLSAALEALLDATEADYAYVDVNRVHRDGTFTWEIVAEATGKNAPDGPDTFGEGDYSQLPEIVDLLGSGRPARVQVSQLAMPIRARYEAEGIISELMAPIMIRDQWVGTLGYTDFHREDEWTDVEVDALMRAAEMVAAYWERDQAREGLAELAESKDRFIATVSHELRTPLSAVVGFAGELADGLDDFTRDEIMEIVALISSQSIEVAHLVEDLLTAERASSGNLTVKPAVIDLHEQVRSIVESLRDGTEVSVEGETVRAWADTIRTRQIVRNLLTNAHRYGGERVLVNVSTLDDQALLVVSDNGAGVTGMDADHIFDPYYRSQTEDTRPDSVGLGLAVARQLARLMGGDLVYRRREGWTRFELTLPVATEPAPSLVGGP